MPEQTAQSKSKWIPFLVGGLPFGIVLMGLISFFFYFRGEDDAKEKMKIPYKQIIDNKQVDDFFTKINEYIGPRGFDSKAQLIALNRAASFIEGSLGAENTGLPVKRSNGQATEGQLYYDLSFDIEGEAASLVTQIFVSYSGNQSPDLEAGHLAAVLTVAQSMLDAKPRHTVRFQFLPRELNNEEFTQLLAKKEQPMGVIVVDHKKFEGLDQIQVKGLDTKDLLDAALDLREKIAIIAE